MKPNFSLILSSEGASLLHRTYSGWARVGDVGFDADDLGAALSRLQERASALPGDRTCKLVIPYDQIKYLSIEADGDPDTAVRAALAGATPYAVSELEYDWTAEGGVISVAAVALETLAEAENFAVEHGFEPVSFAAIPNGSDFGGEPFFGMTKWAAEALPLGTKVERDEAPVHVTGEVETPQDVTKQPSEPVAAAAAKAVAEAGPAPKVSAPEPTEKDAQAKSQTETTDVSTPPAIKDTPPAAKDTPRLPAEKPGDKPDVASAAPSAVSSTETSVKPPANAKTEAKTEAKVEAPAKTPPTAFASIRASRSGESGTGAPQVTAPSRLTRLDGADTAPAASAAPPLPSPASGDVTDPALIAELAASLSPDPDARLDRDAATAAPEPADVTPGLFSKNSPRAEKPPRVAKPKAPPPRHEDEKQRMTVFGARQNEVRGKPRFLGLILTAILLLFLVGVAAWASIFLEDGLARFFGGGDDIKLADVPTADEVDEDLQGAIATGEIAPLPTGEERTASLPRQTAPPRDVATLPNRPSSLSPSEALARYAATGIWQMAPTPPEIPAAGAPLADLFQVSLDPGIGLGAPASLPRRQPDARDTRPEKPSGPPPAGTRYDFDERGFVRATPEGSMTPEGIRIFAGRPSMAPPADMVQTITVTATGSDGEEGEFIIFTGDPTLASVRPRTRPQNALAGSGDGEATPENDTAPRQGGENVQPGDEAETRVANAASAAAFQGDPSLAALRPQPRPRQMNAAAATLQSKTGAAAAPLVDGAALTRAIAMASAQPDIPQPEAVQDPNELDNAFENATPQAVTASLTPLRRPGDFESIVKRTRAKAAAQPVPTSQRMQPALPSSASVAKQATDKDVLNMRKVNLIGVYGSTASRRALVRLGNGRYKKVRVGDTLDGGQVAAIGDSELHYVKRGRNVVLQMPRG
ncbi:hypothetical protein [Roseovarius sp. Pro17]|uniref:hypothetical protein n=1 Tax=Roseovarius sp. Pro17 TaxID=3108175 RepID=UPI002D78483B|nr:hypothetical protein [Roseovarius sp. Pro17]